jgi:hypothetical protein
VESNSLEVVNACSGNEMWWSEATSVFAECVTLVASIQTVELKCCPREANKAHEIARFRYSFENSCNWWMNSYFIVSKLLKDVTIN